MVIARGPEPDAAPPVQSASATAGGLVDLRVLAESLLSDSQTLIPSCSGLRFEVTVGEYPITLTLLERTTSGEGTASARLPLTLLGPDLIPGDVVLFAPEPGELRDFADEACFALGQSPDAVIVDDQQTQPARPEVGAGGGDNPGRTFDVAGLEDFAVGNQAIGVLIARGFSAAGAAAELHARAKRGRTTVNVIARQVVSELGH